MESDLKKDKYGLWPIQNAVLDIYKEFAKICERHGLRHYVAYGTCLGAIRHHGFIPWDDDFDVMMPRTDYEKLKEVLDKELPSHLMFIDWRNAKGYAPVIFGKIQNCNRDEVEAIERKLGWELPQGIYIDIFPLDGMSKRWIDTVMMKIELYLLTAARCSLSGVFARKRLKTCCGRMFGFVVRNTICRISNIVDVAARTEHIARRYQFAPGNLCGCMFGPYGALRDLCEYEVYGEGKEVPFGDSSVFVPVNSDAYLRMLYGDYMVLPSEDKRIPSHGKLPSAPWKFGPKMG